MNNSSNENLNLIQDIKNTFKLCNCNAEEFCDNIIMMALNDNFGKYIQNDMVAEEIFNLSVRYCDNDCDEEDRNAIWTNIEDIVSSI